MRILLVSYHPLVRELGAPKVLIELTDAMCKLGHAVDLIVPADDGSQCVIERGSEYDVIDIDHEHLPVARSRLPRGTLLVVRSVLLVQHLDKIHLPRATGLRATVGRMLKGRRREAELRARIARADANMRQADLINVSNRADCDELIRRGFNADKIIVLPFGLTEERRAAFESLSIDRPAPPVVAFVGTFDLRKGSTCFPSLVAKVFDQVPDARFRLLGTKGLYSTARQVLAHFPRSIRNRIQVVPTFAADRLPELLAGTSVGVFPSFYEGFGFGVLEMLAAGVPVIAFDAPGPPMMLPGKWLVPPGDVAGMAHKVVELLNGDRAALAQEARGYASRFRWDDIARDTLAAYEKALHKLRSRIET